MWRIIGAGWFPYAIFGVPALLLGVFGWGYMKGSAAAMAGCVAEREKDLAQIEELREKTTKADTATVARVAGTTRGVRHEIRAIPTSELCGADGLRYFNAPVDVYNAHTGRAPGPTGEDAAGGVGG